MKVINSWHDFLKKRHQKKFEKTFFELFFIVLFFTNNIFTIMDGNPPVHLSFKQFFCSSPLQLPPPPQRYTPTSSATFFNNTWRQPSVSPSSSLNSSYHHSQPS